MNVGIIEAILRMKDEFSAGIRKAQESFSGLRRAVNSVDTAFKALTTAFAGFAILNAIHKFAELTGKLTDMSAQTGISTTELQKLKFMAEQSGGSLDQVTRAITFMGRSLIGGNTAAVEGMRRLGLNIAEVRRMQPDQAFALIADKIAGISSPMERAAIATALFGRAGAEMLPMMTGNLKALGDEAVRAGIVLDEATVAAGDEFGDALGKAMTAGMALIGNVLRPILPLLISSVEFWSKTASIVGTVLTAAFDKVRVVGQKVIAWLSDTIGKFLEFAKTIPGMSTVIDGASKAFDKLKGAATFVSDAYQEMKPKSEAARTGLDGLRHSVGLLTEAEKKAAKEGARAVNEWLESIREQAREAAQQRLGLQLQQQALAGLRTHIDQNRLATLETIPATRDWAAANAQTTATLQRMIAEGGLFHAEAEKIISQMQRAATETRTWRDELDQWIWVVNNWIGTLGSSVLKSGGQTQQALQDLQKAFHHTSQAVSGVMRGMSGDFTGWVDAVIHGIAAVKSAWSAITGLFDRNKGRDLVVEFAKEFGGFDNLHRELLKLGDAIGEELWIKLTQGVGRNNPEQARRVIEEVRRALEKLAATKVTIPIEFDVDDLPSVTGIRSTEPTGTITQERAAAGDRARGPIVTQVFLDRRMIAEAVAMEVLA